MLRGLIFSGLVLGGGFSSADPVDEELLAALKSMRAPGASILVVKEGQVVLEKGYGFASLEQQTPMRADSIHDLASVSKMFTAAAILRLDQEGRLRISDPINKHLKGPKAWDQITILHLLHHTSGLPDYLGPLGDLTREYTREQMLKAIKDRPLRFEPGEKWEYSNAGYLLLGFLLDDLAGGLAECMEEQFIGPLDLKGTAMNTPQRIFVNRAEGYDPDGNQLMRKSYTSRRLAETADRHLVSTAGDVWRWTKALHHGALLDAERLAIFRTPSAVSQAAGRAYGCGVLVDKEKDGSLRYLHHGGWAGTSTMVSYNPQHRTFYAIFCNLGRVDLSPLEKIIVQRCALVPQ